MRSTHFRAAVEKNPGFGTGYLYLAKALLDANDLTGAEQAAKRGLDSKPDAGMVPLGHYVLADVYSRLGREAEAARHDRGRQARRTCRRWLRAADDPPALAICVLAGRVAVSVRGSARRGTRPHRTRPGTSC